MNVENLDKLATYLEALPVDYRQFVMSDYVVWDHDRGPYEDFISETVRYMSDPKFNMCGTAACAAGHAPAAGIIWDINVDGPVPIGYDRWAVYIDTKFDLDGPTEEFLFGGGWANFDNTHRGAAARIRYILDGFPPPQVKDDEGGMTDFSCYSLICFPEQAEEIVALYKEYLK